MLAGNLRNCCGTEQSVLRPRWPLRARCVLSSVWSCTMPRPLPRDLRKALDLLEAESGRPWNVDDLAAACGVARRTLQKHFRHFLGRTPIELLRELRLDRARQELLRAPPEATVTEVATRSGFTHLGRFATRYRERHGESPSATLGRRPLALAHPGPSLPILSAAERPTIAVLPFELIGPDTFRAGGLHEEIAAAIWRLHWVNVVAPSHARYHLRGKVRDDVRGRLRVTVILVEASIGRALWAERWDGDRNDVFGFEERVAAGVTRAIVPTLRNAEIDRACRRDRTQLNAWELTMRALPRVVSLEAASEGMAIELLEQAIELAPEDALPMSVAAWCHGLRAGHHFTARPDEEKAAARTLAARATMLNTGDALVETMLAAGYTLAHDLEAAAIHAKRALALDGGSAWAWGRSAWIKAYRGEPMEAVERFQIARALAPADPLNFLCSVGIAAAQFDAARYAESIRWYKRALAENPAVTWTHRFLAPTYVLAGRMDEARRSLAAFTTEFPDLTIADVRSGLPWNVHYLDRVAEGLERVGMRP
jgi:AraC-like DNA-binding protein/tetratricopeptide (TPR) repeat protein